MARGGLKPPRGTRDFYPEDLRRRAWLFEHFREVSARFGFEEVDAPILEHAELFIRKAGEEIVEQLYHFELHGRHLALRPEMTPSVSRMVMARAGALPRPLRWFMVGQNWRYERMTRGRRREHYQWNVEILGEPSVTAEAELIAMVFELLGRIGLGEGRVQLRLNSRALLEEILEAGALRGRRDAFEPLCVVVDKLGRIGDEAVLEQLTDPDGLIRLDEAAAKDVVAALSVGSLEEARERAPADSPALAALSHLFDLLAAYDVAEHVVFDASVVRGLAYYTGVVFEAFDAERKLRSVCGGGRYDRMMESLGGPPTPAVGFGFGDAVVMELLEDRGLLPALPRELDDLVFPLDAAQRPAAMALARALRSQGRRVELALSEGRLKRALADADRKGARRFVAVGPEEAARGVARVRDLASGEESEIPLPAP